MQRMTALTKEAANPSLSQLGNQTSPVTSGVLMHMQPIITGFRGQAVSRLPPLAGFEASTSCACNARPINQANPLARLFPAIWAPGPLEAFCGRGVDRRTALELRTGLDQPLTFCDGAGQFGYPPPTSVVSHLLVRKWLQLLTLFGWTHIAYNEP